MEDNMRTDRKSTAPSFQEMMARAEQPSQDMRIRELRYYARKARFAEDAVKMKELRRKLGVSQSEMARKTGVSSSLIWNIENGRGYLSDKMLKRLEMVFPEQNTHSGAMNQNSPSGPNVNNTQKPELGRHAEQTSGSEASETHRCE